MTNTWQVKIKDNLQLVVPADINDFNTYVLLEQEDWHEPEIEFIRIFSEPNLTALDMDTGPGIYALVFANDMEGEGKVVALNPNEHFQESVKANNLQGLISTELDDSLLDFIRLGEAEPNAELLQQGNPLVMFPAKEEHIQFFKDQNLQIYQHNPALNILVPYTEDHTPANLFACSQERVNKLKGMELLVESVNHEISPHLRWLDVMHAWPYARSQMRRWQGLAIPSDYEKALNTFLSSLDQNLDLSARYSLLRQSLKLFTTFQDNHLTTTLALIRIYSDLGYRQRAASHAGQLLKNIGQGMTINMGRPFLSPSSLFDQRAPKQDLGKWLSAAIMYSFDKHRAYTSYYNSQQHLGVLRQWGTGSLIDNPAGIRYVFSITSTTSPKEVSHAPHSQVCAQ